MLGSLWFVIYINDLDENVSGLISQFSEDMKIGGVVDCEEDCQMDIYQLGIWEKNSRLILMQTSVRVSVKCTENVH